MEDLPIDLLYQVAAALLVREVGIGGDARDIMEKALDSINPLEKVEQTRRDDGMLEYDPNMEIPGWGVMGEGDMPEQSWMPPPASAAGDGAVDGFSPD